METERIEKCSHTAQINSICIDCGLCLDNVGFLTSEVVPTQSARSQNLPFTMPMKHVVTNPEKINDLAINKILVPLNLCNYKNLVRNILLETKFNFRLKKEDKVIIAVYRLLKTLEFPIVISDLFKFTSTPKWRLLKVYRDTFKYRKMSDTYLKGIFDRVSDLLKKMKPTAEGSLEEFIYLADKHRCSDPKALCLAYFLESNKLSNTIFEGCDDYTIHQLENIRRKFRK